MKKADAKRAASDPLAGCPEALKVALAAAFNKKAEHVTVLDLTKKQAFTDYFAICSGQNARQVKAIADAIDEALRKHDARPTHIEGYERSEWVLIDCFDFVIHVFTPDTREFYALDRLWGGAESHAVSERSL
ncbi:MAG: ribosome silencing factor [Acidobacteria bacterium]|jgi:ribosome-associated protein|nr:ribosome silencing factor [Acidobacteriota bacterium]